MRAAVEVEHWQKQIPEARRELADAEEIEAIKQANSAEERDRQRLLAG